MMKLTIKALAISVALAFPVAAFAVVVPGAGLTGTDHDFTTSASNTTTIGLCSYCHTPHSAISTSLLWNHKLSANTFAWDDATTTGGTAYPSIAGATYKGPTVKCLSCHDGSIAIGDVAVYKGAPGVYNPDKVGGDPVPTPAMTAKMIGSGGAMKGNHPVGMPYPFGQAANTYNGVTTGANVVKTEFDTAPTSSGAVAAIRLFNDTGTLITAGAVAGKSGMECSTCHDPHNKAATDDFFLRGKIAGATKVDGYICLQCHVK
jgi:hypothetical protein